MPVILYGLLEQRPGHPNFGLPVYVGIGTRYRPYRHFALARSNKKHTNQMLQGVLDAHFEIGIEPIVHIFDTFATNAEAFVAEKKMIAQYGRTSRDPSGILCNLAPGGQSTDGESQRLSWLDEGIREKRVTAMTGVKKTDTHAGRAARQANARLPKRQETLTLLSEAANLKWSNPAFREERVRSQTAAWENPEKRANMLTGRSEGVAQSWENQDIRARRSAAISEAGAAKWKDPEYAEKARAALRASWADPVKKAERVAKMLAKRATKGVQRDPDASARQADVMRAVNASMSAVDRSDIQTRSWSDPEVRARRTAGLKAAAQDPAIKAARLAAMLEGKRKKAAAKQAQVLADSGHRSAD